MKDGDNGDEIKTDRRKTVAEDQRWLQVIVLTCIALEVMNRQIVPWPICLTDVGQCANVW